MDVTARAVVNDDNPVRQHFLLAGDIVSLISSLLSLPIIAVFFWQRFQHARTRNFTIAAATLLLTYITSFLFIFVLTVIIHIRAEHSAGLCDATILLCLTLYIVCKACGFLFLIERAYIISWPVNPRHKTPEYVLSSLCILGPYGVVAAVAIKYRLYWHTGSNVCIIGLKQEPLLALMLVEVLVYLYLTIRFLTPLLMVHFGGQGLLLPLRKVVIRTCIGTAIAMLSVLTVKVSLTMFNGEPAWLCCLTCKIDALIGCAVLHWITKPDRSDEGEHGAPQALGVGFDKESPTSTPEDSGTGSRTDSDTICCGMKGTYSSTSAV